MAREITLDSVLKARNATYGMLARLYREEMDADYLAQMRSMRCPVNTGNVDVDEGYRLFHSYLSRTWERTLEDLERDFLRVFIGANTTGHAAAYPNESVHTSPDRLVMQDARDEVRAIYRAADLKNSDFWKAGEDHIATELEYMQIRGERALAAHAKADLAQTATHLMAQYHFLEDHLLAWVPFLTDDMLKFAQTDFYRALAHLTKGFLEEDKVFLEEVLADEIETERELKGAQTGEGAAGEKTAEDVDDKSTEAPVAASEEVGAAGARNGGE